ncbi:unnamed protein product [Ceratitis capitata]|uniref:(Mediterranean fruit fly) hypothetical protein n=1 Tax=Ceratitis capitata TaxID=7213 RepID=A0A811V7L9_CERCA|nr:unnamed protein product [Ceratitis capitata]
MTSRHTSFGLNSGPAYAILLCLISGFVELLMAVLRLGALVDLISLPVTVGFTSATAVIIGTSQLKGLLGIRGGGGGSGFMKTMESVFTNLDKIRYGDFTLGITAITILLLLRKLKDVKIPGRRILSGTLWVVATGRNALIVLITSVLAYNTCETQESCPFVLTGKVKSGFPDVEVPKFHTTIQAANGTAIDQDYLDMFKELGPSMIILPIIAVLGNVAISKAFSSAGISPTRELVALSLCNVVGSFFSSMPVTGSFSRSAVNHASGVRTPIGGFYTSALVLLALGLLAPYFQYIPKAALSAVIISAVIFMIEFEVSAKEKNEMNLEILKLLFLIHPSFPFKVIKPLWRCSRRELLPGAITFVISLAIGVELGLLLGVGVDVAYLVYRAARPALTVSKLRTTNGTDYILMRPIHSSLYFPAIEWVRTGISKAVAMHGTAPVVLDCSNMHELDFTAARGMGALNKELASSFVPFFLLKASKEICVILKESTNCDFLTIESPDDLEYILDNTASIDDHRLQVTIPLINAQNKVNGGDAMTLDGSGGGGGGHL